MFEFYQAKYIKSYVKEIDFTQVNIKSLFDHTDRNQQIFIRNNIASNYLECNFALRRLNLFKFLRICIVSISLIKGRQSETHPTDNKR